MAEIWVTLKVLPEEVETDLEELKEKLSEVNVGKFKKVEEEPIAFGLVALKPSFVVAEIEGATDKLEEAVRKIKGVGEVIVINATRLL